MNAGSALAVSLDEAADACVRVSDLVERWKAAQPSGRPPLMNELDDALAACRTAVKNARRALRPQTEQMPARLIWFYQVQIRHLSHAALWWFDFAKRAVAENDQDFFFASVHSAVNASANIAKALWGSGGEHAAERADLRESLGITADSPLSDVSLRNHLEHFDERLDRWYRSSERHHYVDFVVGPAHQTIVGTPDSDIFRFYDPDTTELVFWGEHYSLSALVQALERLEPIVGARVATGPLG